MNPWHLDQAGWATIEWVTQAMNVSLTYSTSSSTHSSYCARDLGSEKIIVENRRYTRTFDKSVPAALQADVNGNTNDGGLLIWRARSGGLKSKETEIIAADGETRWGNSPHAVKDIFLPIYYPDGKIHDNSSPGDLRKYNGGKSYFAVTEYFNTGTTVNVKLHVNYDPPAAPQNLDISNRNNNGQSPILVWDASSSPNISHYVIDVGQQFSPSQPVIWNNDWGTTTSTTWTDTWSTIDSQDPQKIYYRVKAVNTLSQDSDYSNETTVNGQGPMSLS